jgi:hypothetical protein
MAESAGNRAEIERRSGLLEILTEASWNGHGTCPDLPEISLSDSPEPRRDGKMNH